MAAALRSHRGNEPVLQPHSQPWQLGRDGIAKFTLDVDGDLEVDLEFTPTTQPQLIEVPNPDGGDPYPLWVCVGHDRELMFSVAVNHAPGEAAALLDANGASTPDLEGPTLCISGACALPPEELFALEPNEALVDAGSGSLIGGVASQEAIKAITHQYVPLNNTFIFNGAAGTTATLEM